MYSVQCWIRIIFVSLLLNAFDVDGYGYKILVFSVETGVTACTT